MNQVGLFFFATTACLALADYTEEEAGPFINDVIREDAIRYSETTAKRWAMIIEDKENVKQAIEENKETTWKQVDYQLDVYKKIIKFPWKTFNDPKLKRLFFAMLYMRYDALPKDQFKKLLKLKADTNGLISKPMVNDMTSEDSPLLSKTDVEKKVKKGGLKADELAYYWKEVHNKVGKAAEQPFKEIIELGNLAARENGYDDFSKLLQAVYEVDDFEETMLQLYEDIKPLFQELHAYVRHKLWEAYGKNNEIINPHGPIPASLLGWRWGMDASAVFDQVAPFSDEPLVNITKAIQDSGIKVEDMIESAKKYYTSWGFSPLPEDFWVNSIFKKKNDNMDCSAAVFYFLTGQDMHYRLKLCAEPTEQGHTLLHSWVGYIHLLLATKDLPYVYQRFPNVAVDTAFQNVMNKFSLAPGYLTYLGIPNTNFQLNKNQVIKTLLEEAMQSIFFLPFALALDQWRWHVADGNITPQEYNCKYWEIRSNLQGVEPPVDRDETDFDPGALTWFISGNEYIMTFISQFIKLDMIRGLCKTAGYYDPKFKQEKPLVFCDVHGNTAVGDKIKELMALGSSQPWYDAMKKMTGNRKLDSSALLEYYEPLYEWLKEQNKDNGVKPGWTESNKCHSKPNAEQEKKVQENTNDS